MASSPIFTATPKTTWTGNLTSGTNTYDGTSGTTLLCTAGASGGFLKSIKFKAAGTNITTVCRIFVNNGSTNGTAANNALYAEINLPATTASATAGTAEIEMPVNLPLQATYRVYAVLATTVAAGWQITANSGDY